MVGVQVVALVVLTIVLIAPSGAPSNTDGTAGDGCQPVHVEHLGQACRRADGFFDVVLPDGLRLRTHGPDPVPPPGDVGFDLDAEQRPPVCADEWTMHVLYGYATGATNRSEGLRDDFQAAIRRTNAVLNADGLESGDVTADYRVLCDAAGEIQIDTFSTPYSSSAAYTADFDAIVSGARAAGFDDKHTDYVIFWDGESSVCGVGNLAGDDSLSAGNENLNGPDYGVVYESCWFGRTPMHENGHTQGAVQDLAPDWDLTGHCLEGIDIMCYPTSDILVLCGDRSHYDCDHDTYFDAAPEPGEWLASHWNLGSRLNRYIEFDYHPPANVTTPATANATAPPVPASPSSSTSTSARPATTSSSTSTSKATTSSKAVVAARASTSGTQSLAPPQVSVQVPAVPAAALLAALACVVGAARRRL